MKKKVKQKIINKEEIAEDWCFACKDGGILRVCDYKQCLKSYHPSCVGKDDSFLDGESQWNCDWHICSLCHRPSEYHCFTCTSALCHHCRRASEFVQFKGKNGFCYSCLKLVVLIEEDMNYDSDGEKVDFKDRETFEGLFMEYYEIIKEKERLNMKNIRSSLDRLNKRKNYKSDSDSKEFAEDHEEESSDSEDNDYGKNCLNQYKKRKTERSNSNREEFMGWGSRYLFEFLASIGKDTSVALSQHDVLSIINDYVKENKLFDPKNKKKIICDASLKSLFRRRTINKYRIYDLLDTHFKENQDETEEDELGNNSEDNEAKISVACKRQRKQDAVKRSQTDGKVYGAPRSYFASIITDNMKLVYLKKSLLFELFEQPESFEEKVIGSFVRVKTDPYDYNQKNSHQLVQVKGIEKVSIGENNTDIILKVSSMPNEIPMKLLSDNDFSEEECEDLRKKVMDGQLARPTVVAFERKARILHKDITKHWISRELALLQKLIDRANEKGWRRELFEYLDRRKKLQTPSEQSRLLENVPTVIPDLEYISDDSKNGIKFDKGSSKSILQCSSTVPNGGPEDNRISESLEIKDKRLKAPITKVYSRRRKLEIISHDPRIDPETVTGEKLNHNRASASEKKQHLAERSASREPVQFASEKKEIKLEACHFKEMPKNSPQGMYAVITADKTPEVKSIEVIDLVGL
ncbi:zinc finger CCCH domain-containing 44 isoform X1 [Olea europaea subsp. europaea]|uniref:Zinc finger CCCH domain-containing 44 isoform X1 n=1 Tax=Olea europaea subsp. europaea TaxID=158383 RepID=A0A8S0SCF8_OLEEU|nr:zinc finger CCCH domain-containing 44 isoform X1 [Olea europaea subsp. europaea]